MLATASLLALFTFTGCGKYYIIGEEEYNAIQEYQSRTGIQVIYPTVEVQNIPEKEKNSPIGLFNQRKIYTSEGLYRT